jgi:hypothetical protein
VSTAHWENTLGNPIGSATQTQVPPPSAASSKPPKTSSPEAALGEAIPTDTVRLSTVAMAALQEAGETPTQTAKEAGLGDLQAKHLLARQAAGHEAQPPKLHVVA